jgi:hypothetical protein
LFAPFLSKAQQPGSSRRGSRVKAGFGIGKVRTWEDGHGNFEANQIVHRMAVNELVRLNKKSVSQTSIQKKYHWGLKKD